MLRSGKGVASLIDLNNPLVCSLGRTFGGILPGRKLRVPGLSLEEGDKKLHERDRRGVGVRTDIVSEKLCDDALEYLAPTLEAYKGCTIIDVNPGACLWSRKLHDYLKPKHHLLMEPDERYHDAFIEPLLRRQGSTFVSTTLAGARPSKYKTALEEVLTGELLPHQPKLDADDPRLRQLDSDLLVTGNLARRHQEPFAAPGSGAAPNYVLQQMSWASLANDLFHRRGLVRMLWWIPDTYRLYGIPEKITYSSFYDKSVQLSANVSEVVGVKSNDLHRENTTQETPIYRRLRRHPILDAESARLVQVRMHHLRMQVPEGRAIRSLAGIGITPEQGVKSPVEIYHKSSEDVNKAFAACKAFVYEALEAIEASYKRRQIDQLLRPLLERLEFPQSVPLVRSLERLDQRTKTPADRSSIGSRHQRAALLLDLSLRIISLEAHCKALEDNGEDVKDLKSRIIALDNELRQRGSGLLKVLFNAIEPFVSDQLALFASPPALSLDRRSFEPLQANSDDFWPRTDLSLVDVVPIPRDLSVPGIADQIEGTRTAWELLRSFAHYQSQALPWVLDKIAPNAAQDLIPKVPSLTDPRKGGRMNVDALQVRNLTDEMIEGLTKAWLEWPFKPERAQLALDYEELDNDGIEAEAIERESEEAE